MRRMWSLDQLKDFLTQQLQEIQALGYTPTSNEAEWLTPEGLDRQLQALGQCQEGQILFLVVTKKYPARQLELDPKLGINEQNRTLLPGIDYDTESVWVNRQTGQATTRCPQCYCPDWLDHVCDPKLSWRWKQKGGE